MYADLKTFPSKARTFNTMIKALFRAKRVDEAVDIFYDMKRAGVRYNTDVFKTVSFCVSKI